MLDAASRWCLAAMSKRQLGAGGPLPDLVVSRRLKEDTVWQRHQVQVVTMYGDAQMRTGCEMHSPLIASQSGQRSIAETAEERIAGGALGPDAADPSRCMAGRWTAALLGHGDRAVDINRWRRPVFLTLSYYGTARIAGHAPSTHLLTPPLPSYCSGLAPERYGEE